MRELFIYLQNYMLSISIDEKFYQSINRFFHTRGAFYFNDNARNRYYFNGYAVGCKVHRSSYNQLFIDCTCEEIDIIA